MLLIKDFNTTLLLFALAFLNINMGCKTDPATETTLQGWWEQEAYGNVYEIRENEIISYNTTNIGCAVGEEYPIEAFSEDYIISNDSLFLKDGINQYRFKKIKNHKNLCAIIDEEKNDDPLYNFDFLWETFNDNYCYFKDRKVNWDDLREKYRSRLTKESTALELYTVLTEMTNEIGDGHVGISADDEIEDAFEATIEKEQEKDDDGPGTIELLGLAYNIAQSNLESVQSYNKGIINYGSISDSILYLQVNSMMLMADFGISDTLDLIPFVQTYFQIGEEDPDANLKEVSGIKNLMETILTQKDYKACVLDIRFNGGGKDEVALEIMSFLSSVPYTIGEKKAYYKGAWAKPVIIPQHTNQTTISGPLVVLTSHETASAAEICTMSALAHPNATIIGSKTEGIFSDMLDKVLPNDWEYSLSNEIYLDHKGISHEAVGIPPDINLNYEREGRGFFDSLNAQNGKSDEAIMKALEVIANSW